jgi:hypothetical protein
VGETGYAREAHTLAPPKKVCVFFGTPVFCAVSSEAGYGGPQSAMADWGKSKAERTKPVNWRETVKFSDKIHYKGRDVLWN